MKKEKIKEMFIDIVIVIPLLIMLLFYTVFFYFKIFMTKIRKIQKRG